MIIRRKGTANRCVTRSTLRISPNLELHRIERAIWDYAIAAWQEGGRQFRDKIPIYGA